MSEHKAITDAPERDTALDTGRSFIVQAPAGSGKTELLMQRFLALLSTAEKPEQILALTFTKKAAGEMQNRITSSLLKAKEGVEPTEPHEKKTVDLARAALWRDGEKGWGLLENTARLKVQTIDSLCASLVRQMPLLSRLGRQPAISDTPQELYAEAAKLTLELVDDDGPDGESVRDALRHLDNSTRALTDRLVIMLSKRDQWMRHVEKKNMAFFREDLEGALRRLVEDELGKARAAFPERFADRLVTLARYAACNLEEGEVKCLEDLETIPAACAGALPMWHGISDLLLTDKGKLRSPKGVNVKIGFPADKDPGAKAAKKEFQELLVELEAEDKFLDEFLNVRALPAPRFDSEEWSILESLLHLLPVAKRMLEDVFRKAGEVDFQEVSMGAMKALGPADAPTDLMLSLDLKVQHILVDEYQDTSRAQLLLLEALTGGWTEGDGRTLFVVGDPMQSIYLFREAEVGLFLGARANGIGGVRLTPLTLKSNFRSRPGLVSWVNSAFAMAFPSEEDRFLGSIRYSPSDAVRKGSGTAPLITLFDEKDDPGEARSVAGIVKSVPPGESVAVLCRSRAHLAGVVERLKYEGIGFRATEFDPLIQRAVVNDLYALLRVLSHPYDRVAWLAALRAPWCGLSLSDLHALVTGDRTSSVEALIADEARLAVLSEDGRERVKMFAGKLEKALEKNGRIPARDLLEGLWVSLGGPACVREASEMEDAEEFFSLVEAAGARMPVKTIAERIARLYASHGGGEGTALDLMTIHKAKGLEFDHVILPGLGKSTRGAEKKLLLWMERGRDNRDRSGSDGSDLLLAPVERKLGDRESPIYKYLTLVNRKKEEFEKARLFYVAATRAKKELYLLGHIERGDGDEIKVNPRSLLSTIKESLTPGMITAGAEFEKEVEGATARPSIRRLPSGWQAPSPLPPADVERGPERSFSEEPEYYWAGETVRHLGTVVHRYLCRIAREGPVFWDARKVEGEAKRMRSALRALGVSGKELDESAKKAAAVVSKALTDERGRWALESHSEGAVEIALTAVIRGEVVHAVIDRTFVEDGARWIIDYKTGFHEGGGLKEFLESEKERYSAQLERYAEVLRAGGESRVIRKGLYYPALSEWVEL